MAWAEHGWRNARQESDGATEGEHKASAARQWAALGRAKAAAMVDVSVGPPFPHLLGDLWKYFCEVSSGVAPSGMAPVVVTWEAISAWSSLMLVTLEPWEAQAMILSLIHI